MNRNRTKQRGSDLYAADASEERSPIKEYVASRRQEGVHPEQVRYASLTPPHATTCVSMLRVHAACTCPHRGRSGVG